VNVSIIIPCFNESNYIAQCLDSLLTNNYSHDNYEILVIDGGSDDGTLEILNVYTEKYPFIRVVNNSKRSKPIGLNIGIKESIGDVIMRIDAHAVYDKNYISTLVNGLYSEDVDNIGGIRDTYIPTNGSAMEIALSAAISSPVLVGNAFYRTGVLSQKTLVDTVFCGCYKKEVFNKIGLFNKDLIRTQDREFNLRLINSGGKIMLDPSTHCTYFPRAKFLEYLKWNWNGAKWLGYASKFTDVEMLSLRNYIPIAFSVYVLFLFVVIFMKANNGIPLALFATLLVPLMIYILLMLVEGVKISIKYRRLLLIPLIPLIAFLTHLSYGFALMYGRIKSFL
jgi:succinoglycan biosynthesis protein ExoA